VIEEIIRLMRVWGPAIDPHAAWLLERGLKTLAIRMTRHNTNGHAVASFLAGHPRVASVSYPGLVSHPDHEIAARTLDGFGGMVGMTIKGGIPAAERFLKRLRLYVHAPSLAGVESLVSEPRLTSHKGFTPEALADCGIAEGFVRLSCGIEDAEDLIADLEQALAR
jgi:cystathionine beta-lyase/cystathionine gamma-synthase